MSAASVGRGLRDPRNMHWSVPLLIFSFLLSFTTVFYHFSTPETIAVKKAENAQARESYWGAVDSDFDWCVASRHNTYVCLFSSSLIPQRVAVRCEYNNVYTKYVSEPFNTVTSGAYPLGAAYAWHMHHRLSLSSWHKLMLLVTMVMGVGSMIFHGTMRYWAQLLDELPLYAMAVLAAAALRQRASRSAGIQPYVATWAAFLAAVIIFSERSSSTHVLMRGVMTVTFSLAFVYIFTALAVAGDEADRLRGGNDGATLARLTVVSFVTAIVSWILDIVACRELQALPLGLPYPQLHAFGWHFGTTLGLLQLFCLMLLHQHCVRDGLEATVTFMAGGLIPRVVATAHQP